MIGFQATVLVFIKHYFNAIERLKTNDSEAAHWADRTNHRIAQLENTQALD